MIKLKQYLYLHSNRYYPYRLSRSFFNSAIAHYPDAIPLAVFQISDLIVFQLR